MVKFSRDTVYAYTDSIFALATLISNVKNLYNFSTDYIYNSDSLEFVEIVEGNFLNDNGNSNTNLSYLNKSNQGIVVVGISRLGQNVSGVSTMENDTLCTIKFKKKYPSDSKITFANLGLILPDGISEFPVKSEGVLIKNILNIPVFKLTVEESDLKLSWNSAAPANRYEIFRSTDPYFAPFEIYESTMDTFFVDISVADDNSQDFYYKIRSANESGVSDFSISNGLYHLRLSEGFNMVSMPVISRFSDLDSLFGGQLTGALAPTESDRIYYFDGSGYQDAWKYSGDNKWYGSLNSFEPDKGYWIELKETSQDTVLTFTGKVSDGPRNIPLIVGWNMIGSSYPRTVLLGESNIIESGFTGGSAPTESDRLYNYLDNSYQDAWLYAPTSTFYGSLTDFSAGKGYWINIISGHQGFTWEYVLPAQAPTAIISGRTRSPKNIEAIETAPLPASKSNNHSLPGKQKMEKMSGSKKQEEK